MQRKPDSYAAAAKGALFLLLCFVPFAMAYAAPDFDLVAPVQSGFQQFLVRVGALVEGCNECSVSDPCQHAMAVVRSFPDY